MSPFSNGSISAVLWRGWCPQSRILMPVRSTQPGLVVSLYVIYTYTYIYIHTHIHTSTVWYIFRSRACWFGVITKSTPSFLAHKYPGLVDEFYGHIFIQIQGIGTYLMIEYANKIALFTYRKFRPTWLNRFVQDTSIGHCKFPLEIPN